jgi:hypothetical protein
MSVKVEFDAWGRMGNRMFQYALGAILAKNKKCNLFQQGIANFNIKPNIGNVVDPIQTIQYGNQFINLDELLNTDRDILINSYVQQSCLFIPYRADLIDIFKTCDTSIINSNKLAIHIRETDYIQIGTFLGYNFYRDLINSSGFTDIIIVTDNSNSETVQRLLSDGCTLSTEGYVDNFSINCDDRGMIDFNTLRNSENIALSQSSFSWWAAFLGQHKTIIFPYTGQKSMWPLNPGRDDIDLYFDLGTSKKFIK